MSVNQNEPDAIFRAFANHGPAIQAALIHSANDLFAGLAVIELVWIIGWSVAHKSDVFDMMIAVTRMAIGLGFWFFLLQNWVQIAAAVTNTFGIWGNDAVTAAGGTANMMPMGFLTAGLNLAHHLWQAMSVREPLTSVVLLIAGLIDVIIFGLIAAQIMLVLIEAFLASYLGSVMMALGANSFTRDFGMSPIRYAISVGMKRMTLQFVAGVSEGIVVTFANQVQANPGMIGWSDLGVMIVIPVILLTVAQIAPKIAQDLILGTHLTTSAGIIATARQIAIVAAGAVLSAAGIGAAGVASIQVTGKQMSTLAAAGRAPSSAAARGATMARLAAGNMAKAGASDVGKRLTGQYSGAHGYRGWRMAESMSRQKNEEKS
jgi:type IV secretion system protein VirB6/type IV secretion system protein TrbL